MNNTTTVKTQTKKDTMASWRIHAFGDTEPFIKESVYKPTPAAGEILIKVKATSVNPIDYAIRNGAGADFIEGLPATIHMDVAGVVEATGAEASRFNVGDEVCGCGGGVANIPGALADYMAIDERLAALKPRNLPFIQAAGLPLVSITAWEALIDKANVQRGQHVLVHGTTGGVGHIGLQLAKWKGATVYATTSTREKIEIGASLGADHGINYKMETVKEYVEKYTDGNGFNTVFDTVGGENLLRSIHAVRPNGAVATLRVLETFDTSELFSIVDKPLSLHGVMMAVPLLSHVGRAHHGEILAEISRLAEEEIVKPLIDPQTFTFDEAAAAHAYAASGDQVGKVVLSHPSN